MQHKVQEAVDTIRTAHDNDAGLLFTAGKDSMAILDLYRLAVDGTPPLLVIDTYNQFDEIYAFRDDLADDWELEYDVRANEAFLEDVIENDDDPRGFAWDGPKTEACCGALKIEVMADFIADGYEHLVVGRRAADVGGDLPLVEEKREPLPHTRHHPLATWSDNHVQAYIKREQIPLPDLYYNGYDHTDCVDCCSRGEEGDDWSGVSPEQREKLNQLRDMGYM